MGWLKTRSSQSVSVAGENNDSRRGLPGRLLRREFYEQRPELVAPRLLGKLLVAVPSQVSDSRPGAPTVMAGRTDVSESTRSTALRAGPGAPGILAGRIVEAEAYLGPHNDPPDPAAHSHRGPTPRTQVLFGLAGHAYVYAIYGRYFCLNVSCEAEGLAGCVLLRAMEPVAGVEAMTRNRGLKKGEWEGERGLRLLASGPSRMCMALGILRTSHNGLDVTDAGSPLQIREDGFRVAEALVTARIGINEANAAVDWPLRFAVPGNGSVSGAKNMKGRRVPVP